ncbi:MAG: carboxypeptidase regulatory-like protein, partial [Pseudonocardiales bacterium]|nr:carboxypeptidase regulatory-like protein [Pseudonocardiales bacterium]
MRVEVTPRQAAVIPGQQQPITITITNTSTVIGGYAVRVLGADPGWVALDADQLSLFPDETRTLIATITAPRGIPAGTRRIAVQVRELTPPEASTITELDLTVPAAKSLQMRVDPLAVTAGRQATFSLIVENAGNTQIAGQLSGDDPEGKVGFAFEPERVALAPGEHAVVDMKAKARRHITGSPTVRMLGVYLDELSADPFFDGTDPDRPPPARGERDALANATFVQRSVLSRGPLSLLGLLAAVTVFAIVITIALSRLVGQTTADRNLALQVAAARNQAATTGTSGVAGTVHLLTSGKPVAGVAVSVFNASDTATPVATT